MANITFVQIEDHRPQRIRKAHSKVRTGCQTCKIRKKKCDESKPACDRCTSTGRKCDGYGDPPTKSVTIKPTSQPDLVSEVSSRSSVTTSSSSPFSSPSASKARDQPLKLWRPPQSAWLPNEQDYHCFDFFRRRTGPDFAAYFDSSIWRDFVVRACFLHPTVLQAAAAVGAVHRRFELGISPEGFRYCGVAVNQYRKALKSLDEDPPVEAEVNMVVSILLGLFEAFQGNYDSAISQYQSGLTALFRPNMKRIHSETRRKTVKISYESLQKFTERLEARAPQLFGTPTHILSQPASDGRLEAIPEEFTTLEEARDCIITEGRYIWHAWTQLELGKLKGFSTQHLHVSRLLEWSKAYAEYAKSERGQSRPPSRQSYLLKIYREAMYLVILTQLSFHEPDGQVIIPLCSLPETCTSHTLCHKYMDRQSVLNAQLARVTMLAESVFNQGTLFEVDKQSITIDSGMGLSLLLGPCPCRSTKVRYQATSLLTTSEFEQKVWKTMGVYNIAEKMGSLEEHAVRAAVATLIPNEPKWIDATCLLEDRKILLRHCREDDFGGLLWTQEWLTY